MRQKKLGILITIAGLGAVALAYWGKGLFYLVDGPGGTGAIDLRQRWIEQRYVLHRQNPYDVYFASLGAPELEAARRGRDASAIAELGPPTVIAYPPWAYFSGYALLWPPWGVARLYYAVIQLLCLCWLVR